MKLLFPEVLINLLVSLKTLFASFVPARFLSVKLISEFANELLNSWGISKLTIEKCK